VYRDLDEEGSVWLCTDRRSSKHAELIERGRVELCWYFLQSREQYRLRGEVELIVNTEQRERIWAQLSLETRAQFNWPQPKESRGEDAPSRDDSSSFQALVDASVHPNFFLFKVVPHCVDHLSLGERHRRFISHRSMGRWHCDEVNP
jgi:hypothetical protein